MSKPALVPLHQAIKKSFQCIENNQKIWKNVLTECGPLMVSLGNLAEQSIALSKVQLSNTPLRVFPDLEDRLRFKQQLAIDAALGKMNDKLSSLQSVRDSISNQVSGVFQLYEQNAESLDIPTLTERSAISPSVSDMLEWLQDVDRHYRREFLRRKLLLQTLRPSDLSLLESAPKRWTSLETPAAEDYIYDILCKVSFFMEAQ